MYTKLRTYIKILLICSFSISAKIVIAQIEIPNASLEDQASDATAPQGWYPCEPNTTPDILPGFWGVYLPAQSGETYVGLISRSDGSFESISTRTKEVLEANKCYKMSLHTAHSRTYAGFNKTLKLRIYAATNKCGKDQLIYESERLSHQTWQELEFEFRLDKECHYLLIEAFDKEQKRPYKGNILIDNISLIYKCDRA